MPPAVRSEVASLVGVGRPGSGPRRHESRRARQLAPGRAFSSPGAAGFVEENRVACDAFPPAWTVCDLSLGCRGPLTL